MAITKTVTLDPGESGEVAFTFTPSVARVHQISVDGLSGSLNVLEVPAAEFEVTDLIITPSEVYVGELVSISVLVTNIGGSRGSKTITLEVI